MRRKPIMTSGKINTVTRRQVLRAIAVEPLSPGQWVERSDLNKIGDCKVCLVGGALRQAHCTNTVISYIGMSLTNMDYRYSGERTTCRELACINQQGRHACDCPVLREEVKALISEKRHLTALSCLFEATSKDMGRIPRNDRYRKELAATVKKLFPTVLNLD